MRTSKPSRLIGSLALVAFLVGCTSRAESSAIQNPEGSAFEGAGAVIEGDGQQPLDVDWLGSDGPVMVHFDFDGGPMSFFGVRAETEPMDLVDSIGPWAGLTVVTNPETDVLEVNTLGAWTAQFVPLDQAEQFTPDASGSAPTVLAVPEDWDHDELVFSFSVEDAAFADTRLFRVYLLTEDGVETLYRSAGVGGSGPVVIPAGSHVFVADTGEWSFSESSGKASKNGSPAGDPNSEPDAPDSANDPADVPETEDVSDGVSDDED